MTYNTSFLFLSLDMIIFKIQIISRINKQSETTEISGIAHLK